MWLRRAWKGSSVFFDDGRDAQVDLKRDDRDAERHDGLEGQHGPNAEPEDVGDGVEDQRLVAGDGEQKDQDGDEPEVGVQGRAGAILKQPEVV